MKSALFAKLDNDRVVTDAAGEMFTTAEAYRDPSRP
jgi:hypothetical protein